MRNDESLPDTAERKEAGYGGSAYGTREGEFNLGMGREEDRAGMWSATQVENRPIEPERGSRSPSILKWILFVVVVGYIILSFYRVPILTRAGEYLVVEHDIREADLIVCLAGGAVERGLQTADLYQDGLAPRILISRATLPDGSQALKGKGVSFPERRDLLMGLLMDLGIPRSALIAPDSLVESTFEEATTVREVVDENGFQTVILVTSPSHSRRVWLTFKKVFENDDVEIMVKPSKYSDFSPQGWWKTRKFFCEVAVEYQKLLYYSVKYL